MRLIYCSRRIIKIGLILALMPIFLVQVVFPGVVVSSNAAAGDTTDYSTSPGYDTVFVYNLLPDGNILGSLMASSTDTTRWDFFWYKYNPSINSYVDLTNEVDVTSSSINNLQEGGYRLTAYSSTDTFSWRGWIFLNDDFTVEIKNKNNDGKIKTGSYACGYVDLIAEAVVDTFKYYDPATGEIHFIINEQDKLDVNWTSDKDEKVLSKRLTTRMYSPPPENTTYYLEVIDKFGNSRTDEVLYESIETKAEFTAEVKGYYADDFSSDLLSGSSPLEARFTNKSLNGVKFEWTFVDSAVFVRQEPELVTTDTSVQPEFTYYEPKKYYVKLISTSEAGCVDSFTMETAIEVEASIIEMPNVFTPNGDGMNDYFRPRDLSLKSFTLKIFDRWGRKVYEKTYDESDFSEWLGWDGTINDKRPAVPGIYYYTLLAYGWDDEKYRIPHRDQTGYFYLFRSKSDFQQQ